MWLIPNTLLYRPAVVELEKANNDESYGTIIEKHGRHESQPLAGLGYGINPQVGKFANVTEAVSAHFPTEEGVAVPDTFLEGAVLLGGDDTLPQQPEATGMEGDATRTLDGVVHLGSAAAGSAQNLTIVLIPTSETE